MTIDSLKISEIKEILTMRSKSCMEEGTVFMMIFYAKKLFNRECFEDAYVLDSVLREDK